jgi:hypothetical protein
MKNIFLLTLVATFMSCDNNSEDDFKTIEDIQLGISLDSYYKSNDSLNISKNIFYTQWIFDSYDEAKDHEISMYYTDIFDFAESINTQNNIHHYGFITPQLKPNSEIIYSYNVLLGHTNNALGINEKDGIFNLTKTTKKQSFIQISATLVINKVEQLLKSKYGEPELTTINFNKFYLIEGKKFSEKTNSDMNGELLTWTTKLYKVFLFKGFDDKKNTYNTIDKSYFYSDTDNLELVENEFHTKKYAYLKYELKEEITQDLLKEEFNKIKL